MGPVIFWSTSRSRNHFVKPTKKTVPVLNLERQLGAQFPSPTGPVTQSNAEGADVSRVGRARRTPARLDDYECQLSSKPRQPVGPAGTSTPVAPRMKKRKLETQKASQGTKKELESVGGLQLPTNRIRSQMNKIFADNRQNSFVVTG